MQYRFFLTYTPTDGTAGDPRECHPNYSDDLAVTIDREDGEWYYKRKLDGSITFQTADYSWIMGQAFDGTFTLTIKESHDLGAHWYDYFEGTFSRANLDIDEDNHAATIASFIEGVYNAIENGKDEEFDLMKLIPDSNFKTVQSQVWPALALVDECSSAKVSFSDIYCLSPFTSGGYKDSIENYHADDKNMADNPNGRLNCIWVEAKLTMDDETSSLNGHYTGFCEYKEVHQYGSPLYTDQEFIMNSLGNGHLYSKHGTYQITLRLHLTYGNDVPSTYIQADLPNGESITFDCGYFAQDSEGENFIPTYYSPIVLLKTDIESHAYASLEMHIHYIYSSLLTYSSTGVRDNILNVGAQYKGIARFQGGGLTIYSTPNTVDYPNGYRLVPGSDENGSMPQYFAPPDDEHNYIPVAQQNWQYASLWYTIEPSVQNGLLNPSKMGTFALASCFPIGTCIRCLLDRISNHKIIFNESTESSRFLYELLNPVTNKLNFSYLITQKTNLMNSDFGSSATRCIVRLNWFLELLRNAFNCYYWLEKRDDGKYLFRIEHVEYFRNGGRYDGDLDHSIDLTTMTPGRNFPRDNSLVKHLSDQTNKYKYDLKNMAEKYTFSWQGDGGSDAFKGNPMFFKAGWIETGSSEDHQVDNIFADLTWLLLNAGTDTASSKNRDGVFLFAGYASSYTGQWIPGMPPLGQYLVLAQNQPMSSDVFINLTIPNGQQVTLETAGGTIATYTGDGSDQDIIVTSRLPYLRLNFGSNFSQLVINYITVPSGNTSVYQVAVTPNLLRNDGSTLQNGPLAWPWLQNDFLHYDIPARKWSFNSDDLDSAEWQNNGTVKMVQKQEISIFPMPEKATEDTIMAITGIRTAIEGGKTGIITNAKINLSSRNAELTVIYNPDS